MKWLLALALISLSVSSALAMPCSQLFKPEGSRRLASAENEAYQTLKKKLEKETDPQVLKSAATNLFNSLASHADRDQAFQNALMAKAGEPPIFLAKARTALELRSTALYLMKAIWHHADHEAVQAFLSKQSSLEDLDGGCSADDPVLSDKSHNLFKN